MHSQTLANGTLQQSLYPLADTSSYATAWKPKLHIIERHLEWELLQQLNFVESCGKLFCSNVRNAHLTSFRLQWHVVISTHQQACSSFPTEMLWNKVAQREFLSSQSNSSGDWSSNRVPEKTTETKLSIQQVQLNWANKLSYRLDQGSPNYSPRDKSGPLGLECSITCWGAFFRSAEAKNRSCAVKNFYSKEKTTIISKFLISFGQRKSFSSNPSCWFRYKCLKKDVMKVKH